MLSLGPRPTFADENITMEAHLFDVRADFYGACVRVDFVAFLRDIVRFGDAEELRGAMEMDERNARDALTLQVDGNNINSLVQNRA
jgi:riboflavin kinase/FMN adenylyltransferase